MHFSNPLAASPTPLFPIHLLPSLPFRRRKSSSDSTATITSTASSTAPIPQNPPIHLSNSTSILRCANCLNDICPTTSIISKGFTGRHGRAFLVAPPTAASSSLQWTTTGDLPNTTLDRAVPRQLVTGHHTVADLRCRLCDSVLGWKYVAAEDEGQRYKVGKFILETRKVVKGVEWEGGEEECSGGAGMGGPMRAFDPGNGSGDDVEFDSQDEDECEDLFAGVWSPALARKRRARKLVWRRDADVDMV